MDWAFNVGTGMVAKTLQTIVCDKCHAAISSKTLKTVVNFASIKTIEKLQKHNKSHAHFKTLYKG